ncbi:hypothetical protein [Crateriforma spongiae]|nr:hypothetical protein [Crateriforma spongiae]
MENLLLSLDDDLLETDEPLEDEVWLDELGLLDWLDGDLEDE